MNTLFDFMTAVKGMEYILALLGIAAFIFLWELLKPAPFRSVLSAAKDDARHVHEEGKGHMLKTVGKIIAAPFIGLAYVLLLPFAFFAALAVAVLSGVQRMLGHALSFGWRPMEAYLAGRKGKKKR